MNYYGRYTFVVEWYDVQAALGRRYILTFHCSENSVEMFDLKNKRIFLKKYKVDNIHLRDLYIGNCVNIMSRLLEIVDYADNYTRRMLGPETEKAFLIVKPEFFSRIGTVIDLLICEGFRITRMRSVSLTQEQSEEFYADINADINFRLIFLHLASGTLLAIEVMKQDALCCLKKLIGPSDPERARSEAPDSWRAHYGIDKIKNAFHCSETPEKVEFDSYFFFCRKDVCNSAVLLGSTCVVVKPHAVTQGMAGKIIQTLIDSGYEITACAMFKLDKLNAAEFYEVYKGVVSDYQAMVDELCYGPCIALEVKMPVIPSCSEPGLTTTSGPQLSVRDFVGPFDPDLARKLRPCTMRAMFGCTRVQNAVHVTDLVEDSCLELEYFFKILDG